MCTLIFVSVWISGSIVAYFLLRNAISKDTGWTVGERARSIAFSLIGSWLAAVSTLMADYLLRFNGDDKEAKW